MVLSCKYFIFFLKINVLFTFSFRDKPIYRKLLIWFLTAYLLLYESLHVCIHVMFIYNKPEENYLKWLFLFLWMADISIFHFGQPVFMICYDWDKNEETWWSIHMSLSTTVDNLFEKVVANSAVGWIFTALAYSGSQYLALNILLSLYRQVYSFLKRFLVVIFLCRFIIFY